MFTRHTLVSNVLFPRHYEGAAATLFFLLVGGFFSNYNHCASLAIISPAQMNSFSTVAPSPQQHEDDDEWNDAFENHEEKKRKLIDTVMGMILVCNLILINALTCKYEPRYMNPMELNFLKLDVGVSSIFILFFVYHVEKYIVHAFNYLFFFGLVVAVQIPHYTIATEIFIPGWILCAVCYTMFSIAIDTMPFFLYPDRLRTILQKRQADRQRFVRYTSTTVLPSEKRTAPFNPEASNELLHRAGSSSQPPSNGMNGNI